MSVCKRAPCWSVTLFKTLIRNKQQIACEELWIAFGAGKRFRYIAAHELAAALGGDKAESTRCLPCLYRVSYNVILIRTVKKVCLGLTWSNFPQMINVSLELYSHLAELSESCLAAIECFVLRYMTEQASVGLWTTLVSSCSHRKVEHWKHSTNTWCSDAAQQALSISGWPFLESVFAYGSGKLWVDYG